MHKRIESAQANDEGVDAALKDHQKGVYKSVNTAAKAHSIA